MIFGTLVGLITAGAYAVADEIRVAHKIASYSPSIQREQKRFDYDLERKLHVVFSRNWDSDGATLYPPKLIPFLASDDHLRYLWVQQTVWTIMGCQPPNSNRFDTYLKFDRTSNCCTGPQLYEYDFVARYYPEDWEKYKQYRVEQKEQEKKSQELWEKRRRRTFALPIILIVLGAIITTAGAALIKPQISEIIFKPIIIGGFVILCVGAAIGLIRRDEWED